MNPNLSSMKIETDTFVSIICVAAFIGYMLGIQHRVINVIKTQHTQQQSNKVHKTTQTNLSELAELLTLNNMMVDRNLSNDEVCYNLNTEDSKNDSIVEPKVECEVEGVNSNKYNDNVSDNVSNSFGNINSPEEEYEVITDSIKKLNIKKKYYYFGWFDSIF